MLILLIVLLASIVGISLMVLLNRHLGLNTPAVITSLEDARERLDVDQIGFEAGAAAILSDDGKTALVEERQSGRFGLLAARGDTIVIRYLEPGSVRTARMGEGKDIELSLNDFTFAPVRIAIADRTTARQWADRLNSLQA